jgi:outer membrane protein
MKIFKIFVCCLLFVAGTDCYSQDSILTLQDAIKYALQHNYDITISKNEAEITKIQNNWAAAGVLPSFGVTANKIIGTNNIQQKLNNGNETNTSGATTQNLNAGLAISWRAFDGFKMFATKKRLEELEKIGQFTFIKTANESVYTIIQNYYNISLLLQQLKAIVSQLDLYRERLKIADARFTLGSAAKNDLLQAQVDLNEQLSDSMNIQNQIQVAKATLNDLMGRKPDIAYTVVDTITLNPLPSLTEIKNKVDTQNPDILIARSNVMVLQQTRKEINSQRLPIVTLNGNYNFVRSSNTAGFTLLNQTYGPSASIGVTVPLFSGLIVKKQLEVADIQLKDQNIVINKLNNNIDRLLTTSFYNYQNALNIVALERENLKLSQENIFIATERFKELNITSVELRQVQISYIDARNRLYNALYQAKLAEAQIALLTGEILKL